MSKPHVLMQRFISSCFQPVNTIPAPTPDHLQAWKDLEQTLEKNSLLAFAYHCAKKEKTDWIPPADVFIHWKRAAHRVAMQNAILERNAADLFTSLNEAGIHYVMLKGFAMADAAYENRTIREIGDIDILVGFEDLDKTIEKLEEAHYSFHPIPEFIDLGDKALQASKENLHELSFRKSSGPFMINVDLHIHSNRYLKGSLIDNMFPESSIPWLAHTRLIEIEGISVKCLDLEREFLFSVFHYVLHHFLAGPKWCVDICQFLQKRGNELDWHALSAQISNLNLRHLIILALYICTDLIGDQEMLQKTVAAGFDDYKLSVRQIKRYQANIFKDSSLLRRYKIFLSLPASFADRLRLLRFLSFDQSASMEGRNPEIKRNKWSNLIFVLKRALHENK